MPEGLQEHADRLRVRQGEIDDLRGRRSLALVQGNYLKALGYTLGVQWGRYGMYLDRRRKPVREQPGAEDEILENGHEGEALVQEGSSRRLNDRSVLFAGYRNARGEIDQILVNAQGVFAFEIKNIRGFISCDGDKWARDKYDSRGEHRPSKRTHCRQEGKRAQPAAE